MSPGRKFVAWVAALYSAVMAVLVAVAALVASGLPEADAVALERILELRAPGLLFAAVMLAFICAGAVKWFFADYVTAARTLADQTRIITSANADLRLPSDGAPELGELAAAVNELAAAYGSLRRDSDTRAAEARSRLEEERNRLAALMSELTQGVLVCNEDGTILLYNEQARRLFA